MTMLFKISVLTSPEKACNQQRCVSAGGCLIRYYPFYEVDT